MLAKAALELAQKRLRRLERKQKRGEKVPESRWVKARRFLETADRAVRAGQEEVEVDQFTRTKRVPVKPYEGSNVPAGTRVLRGPKNRRNIYGTPNCPDPRDHGQLVDLKGTNKLWCSHNDHDKDRTVRMYRWLPNGELEPIARSIPPSMAMERTA